MRSTDVTRWFCGVLAALATTGLAAATRADHSTATSASEPACSKKNGGPAKYLTTATSNGPVTGHIAPGTACVLEYLGVPYANPPVGDLRFAAPRPIDTQTPYVAANFGFDCPLSPSRPVANYPGLTPQALDVIKYFASGAGTPQSEDCLTLNIWTKATEKASRAKKPVVVFFYGGRFSIGNTNSPFYNGKYLANNEDLVVVTVNYRINIFGFPGAPGEVHNPGLRDQRAAVEWVRANIAHFDGDAHRIILAGQSSGGVAADYWAYAYEKDPIAAGLILASGNAFSFPLNNPSVTSRNWNTVVAAAGCNITTNPTTIMSCMRAADWTLIKSAAATIRPSPSTSVLRSIPAFYPQVDNITVFPDYVARIQAGRFARLPILGGNGDNEAGYYRIPAFGNGGVVPTPEQVSLFHLESFTCPASYQANSRRAKGVAAWVYRYFGDWENTRLYPTSGSYHGVDMHMVFGASGDVSGIEPTARQRALTRQVQRAWFAFASDPCNGLQRELGWPKWDSKEETLVVLGCENKPGVRFVKPAVYDALCGDVVMGALGVVTSAVSAVAGLIWA